VQADKCSAQSVSSCAAKGDDGKRDTPTTHVCPNWHCLGLSTTS
jgi:hypothetical protein